MGKLEGKENSNETENRTHHRHYRTGWFLSHRAPASKNYKIIGLMRKTSALPNSLIAHLSNKIISPTEICWTRFPSRKTIRSYQPDEIYNSPLNHTRVNRGDSPLRPLK